MDTSPRIGRKPQKWAFKGVLYKWRVFGFHVNLGSKTWNFWTLKESSPETTNSWTWSESGRAQKTKLYAVQPVVGSPLRVSQLSPQSLLNHMLSRCPFQNTLASVSGGSNKREAGPLDSLFVQSSHFDSLCVCAPPKVSCVFEKDDQLQQSTLNKQHAHTNLTALLHTRL